MLVDEANYAPSILSQNGCGLGTGKGVYVARMQWR